MQDLIAWNEANKAREMPFFGQELFTRVAAKGSLKSDEYLKLKADLQRRARASIDGPMAKHRLDALVAPSSGPPWVVDLVNGDSFTGSSTTRSPDIRTSPFPRASCTSCRWGSRSSAEPTASKRCCGLPTRTSKRVTPGNHRASCRAFREERGAEHRPQPPWAVRR